QVMNAIVLIDVDGRAYVRSRAFVRSTRYLPRPWRWAYALRFVPAFLLDLGYRLVARLRYRIGGRADVCQLPSPEERSRFLPWAAMPWRRTSSAFSPRSSRSGAPARSACAPTARRASCGAIPSAIVAMNSTGGGRSVRNDPSRRPSARVATI